MAQDEEKLLPKMAGAQATQPLLALRRSSAPRRDATKLLCAAAWLVAVAGVRGAAPNARVDAPSAEWKPWEVPEGHTIPMEVDEDKFIPPKQNY